MRRRMSVASWASVYASVLAVVAGAVLLALVYHRALHALVLLAWAAVLAVVWGRQVIAPVWAERRDNRTAEELESQYPHLRSDVTSSLEFGRALETSDPGAARRFGSPSLMQALVSRTAQELERDAAHLDLVLPRRSLGHLRKAAIGAFVAFAFVFLLWPDSARTGLSRLFTGPPPKPIGLFDSSAGQQEPLVTRIIVTYDYPAYTRREPISIANPTGRIEVLAGTEVELQALALRDVTGASLVLQTGEGDDAVETEIDMTATGRDLRARFTPLQSSTYTFEVTTTQGERLRDPVLRSITVIPDAAPQIELITPDSVVQAAPNDVIPFRFAVSDDFGLTELAFVHAFSGDPEHERREVLLALDGELVLQEGAGFDLAPLALQPRDEVVVYVEGVDNDTIGGPKAGRSRPVLVRITSPEDRHLALVEREEEIYEGLLGVLGDYLENPIANMQRGANDIAFIVPDLPPEGYGQRFAMARSISETVRALLGSMRDLLAQLEMDELMLQRDYELIQAMYERLYDLHRSEQNVITSLGRPASLGHLTRYHMQRLEDVRRGQVSETERSILQLGEILESQRMENLQRTMEELNELRAHLRELLEQYRETRDPEIRAEIERELMRLEARMRELMQRLAEQIEQLPSEHYNLQALEEMGELGDVQQMSDALQRIRDMLDAGDIEGALNALDDLGAQLDSMLQQVSTSESMGGGGLSELDRRMSELVDEINNLEAQESEIEQETGVLQEEIRQRRIEALQEGLDEFVRDARQRVAEMMDTLSDIDREQLRSNIRDALNEAEDHLESLDQMLEAEDFESALERAEQAVERLSNAEFQLRSLLRRFGDDSSRGQMYGEALDRVEPANEAAQGLADDLDDLLERARPRPDDQDMPRLGGLAEAQQMTLQELAELLQRVEEMSQDMPTIGEELRPDLGRVENFMEGAERQLRMGRIQGAREDEQSSLRQLRDLRNQMERMVQREHMEQRMGSTATERVEIPEEPDETPAEFREEILDAMREESLESYREAIRRYYESLVQ